MCRSCAVSLVHIGRLQPVHIGRLWLVHIGRLSLVQYRTATDSMPPHAELVLAGLAEQVLNRVIDAMMTKANQGMNCGVGNPAIRTLLIITGIDCGINAFRTPA